MSNQIKPMPKSFRSKENRIKNISVSLEIGFSCMKNNGNVFFLRFIEDIEIFLKTWIGIFFTDHIETHIDLWKFFSDFLYCV